MTVVKDNDIAGVEEVAGASEVAEAEDKDKPDLMTDSRLPDDWSIIESKGLDNEGSDGESVEVIPCEEEKYDDGASAETTSPNESAIEMRENTTQTEHISPFELVNLCHPGILTLFLILHFMICMSFYAAVYQIGYFDVKAETASMNLRPALVELMEDWEQMSSRSQSEKVLILKFFKIYFPMNTFDEEIVALLEKDMAQDSTMSPFHQKRPYTPNPPPSVQHKATKAPPPPPPVGAKDARARLPPVYPQPGEHRFDCSKCKKYSSNCKKFCKGKNWKYYFDKYIAPVLKKFPHLKNNF